MVYLLTVMSHLEVDDHHANQTANYHVSIAVADPEGFEGFAPPFETKLFQFHGDSSQN